MAVITISRQYGSGGNEIVDRICKATGYHLFDKQIIAMAAFDAGLADQEIVDYSEDNYKVKNFFNRLFSSARPVTQVRIWKEDRQGVRLKEEIILGEEHALFLERKAIEKAYKMGSMVIVGRGGQVILGAYPDVLHVRIQAPFEERLQRVRSYPILANRTFSDSVEARRAAQDLIITGDAASEEYMKRFYGVDWSDPQLYHMIINTSKMGLELAANVIVEAAKQLEGLAQPAY
jgi:cytidylate kinase